LGISCTEWCRCQGCENCDGKKTIVDEIDSSIITFQEKDVILDEVTTTDKVYQDYNKQEINFGCPQDAIENQAPIEFLGY